MSETLAFDLGASTAKLARRSDAGAVTSEVVPALVARAADGRLVVGRAAAGIAAENPERATPIPVERAGDRDPLLLAGEVCPPAVLVAEALAGLARVAADRLAAAPSATTLVHPAHWVPAQREALLGAARRAGLPGPGTVAAPVAAARQLLDPGAMPPGSRVALCDVGATVEVSILRSGADGAWALEDAEGRAAAAVVPGAGGLAWDDLVLDWVWASLDDDTVVRAVRATGLQGRRADAAALRSARQAREALTSAPRAQVTIPVPGDPVVVDIRRSDLVGLLAPSVLEVAASVLRLAGDAAPLAAVRVVGAASATPHAAALIAEALGGTPVEIAPRPATAAAEGAAFGPVALTTSPGPRPTIRAIGVAALAASPDSRPTIRAFAAAGAPGGTGVVAGGSLAGGRPTAAPPAARSVPPPSEEKGTGVTAGGPVPVVAGTAPKGRSASRRQRRWAAVSLAAAVVVAALIVFGTSRSHTPLRAVSTGPSTVPKPRSTKSTVPKKPVATAPPLSAPTTTTPPTTAPVTTPPPAKKTSTTPAVPSLAAARGAVLSPALLGQYATLLGQVPFCAAVPKPSVEVADDYRLANGGWLETLVAAWPTSTATAGVVRDMATALAGCVPGAPPVVVAAAPSVPSYGQQSFVGESQAVLTSGAPYTYYLGVVRDGDTVSVLLIRNANTHVALSTYDVIFAAAAARLGQYVR